MTGKADRQKLRELAADIVQGIAAPAEQTAFYNLLAGADAEACQEVAQLFDLSALLSMSHASPPTEELRKKILAKIAPEKPRLSAFKFVRGDDQKGWRRLSAPGAYIKLLSINREHGYAVALGKLEAGCRYHAHAHAGPEEIFVISGDLVVGDIILKAGDFHHADPGSAHGENYTNTGCMILAVLTLEDIKAQMA